ncbi:MAG: hypothetical protein ACOX87_10875, partial [Chloroflexota bacterium]
MEKTNQTQLFYNSYRRHVWAMPGMQYPALCPACTETRFIGTPNNETPPLSQTDTSSFDSAG